MCILFRAGALALGGLSCLAQTLQITAPQDGVVVAPGQTIFVMVAAAGGTFTQVGVVGQNPIGFSSLLTSAPFQFSITLPSTISVGLYHLTAVGNAGTNSLIMSSAITLNVETATSPVSIAASPASLILGVLGQRTPIQVVATFPDASTANVTGSSQISYTSSNTAVATVSPTGIVTAVGTGSASISATYARAASVGVPITVLPFRTTTSPTSLAFGNTAIGATSSQQAVTLTNSGSSSLNAITVAASGDFTETDNCAGKTIASGGTCTVNVTYAPTMAGPENGQLSIINGFDVVPLSVALSGVGISTSSGTLTVSVTHSGTLSTGQSGLAYSISVNNVGQGAFSGSATINEALPSTLTPTSLSGTGWTCTLSPASCTRSDTLAASSSYSTITATVNVSANAPTSVSNTVWLSAATTAGATLSSATDTAAVGPLLQTIAFGPLNNVTMGTPPFSVTATASSGLPVTFTSTTTSVCSVAGSTVTILAVGTCTITASQAGNGTFPAAASVTQNFNVTAAWQIINFPALNNVALGAPPLTVNATASSGLAVTYASNTQTACTVAGNAVTLLTAGTCSITANQAGNANYAAATPVTKSFTITVILATPPTADSVSPASGNGVSQAFTFKYSSVNGKQLPEHGLRSDQRGDQWGRRMFGLLCARDERTVPVQRCGFVRRGTAGAGKRRHARQQPVHAERRRLVGQRRRQHADGGFLDHFQTRLQQSAKCLRLCLRQRRQRQRLADAGHLDGRRTAEHAPDGRFR